MFEAVYGTLNSLKGTFRKAFRKRLLRSTKYQLCCCMVGDQVSKGPCSEEIPKWFTLFHPLSQAVWQIQSPQP